MSDTKVHGLSPSRTPRRFWQRVRRTIILYGIVPYVAVIVVFTAFQRRLIYQPTVASNLHIANVAPSGEIGIDVALKTDDGNTLRGWLLYAKDGGVNRAGRAPLVLYFPGNSLNRHARLDDLREIASQGFDVLIVDYRGFGDSTGSPTETDLSADARRVWDYARGELGYDESRIVVFGESLGGAVALSLWSREDPAPPRPAAVILNATFASMPQTVAWHYPLFPFQFLLLDRWPSIERIGRVTAPVVVFHGADDRMVPVSHGQALARAASQARFLEIPGAGHNEIPLVRLRNELDAIRRSLTAGSSASFQQLVRPHHSQ